MTTPRDVLAGVPLFSMLPNEEVDKLARRANELTVPAGTVVTDVDRAGVAFGVIVDGQAAVSVRHEPPPDGLGPARNDGATRPGRREPLGQEIARGLAAAGRLPAGAAGWTLTCFTCRHTVHQARHQEGDKLAGLVGCHQESASVLPVFQDRQGPPVVVGDLGHADAGDPLPPQLDG